MTIKLIRMSSGEDVVATVVGEVDDAIQIKDAIVIIPTGNNQLGFAPWSPVIDQDVEYIEVFKKFIVYVSKPNTSVIEQYKSLFSTVVTPPEKKIIL